MDSCDCQIQIHPVFAQMDKIQISLDFGETRHICAEFIFGKMPASTRFRPSRLAR